MTKCMTTACIACCMFRSKNALKLTYVHVQFQKFSGLIPSDLERPECRLCLICRGLDLIYRVGYSTPPAKTQHYKLWLGNISSLKPFYHNAHIMSSHSVMSLIGCTIGELIHNNLALTFRPSWPAVKNMCQSCSSLNFICMEFLQYLNFQSLKSNF